jgi:hypothetical protein
MNFPLELRFKLLAIASQIAVTDAQGQIVYYAKQKAFKLKEAVTVFADENQTRPLFKIAADRVLDISARYRIEDEGGAELGVLQRRGMRSLWKAHYEIHQGGRQTFLIREESAWVRVLDGIVGASDPVDLHRIHVPSGVSGVARRRTADAASRREAAGAARKVDSASTPSPAGRSVSRRRGRQHSHDAVAGTRARLIPAAAFELIRFIGKEDVEAGERSVTPADVALQLHLHVFRQIGRVHLLLERSQPVPEHDDFVKEGLNRPGLFLKPWRPRTQDQRAVSPFLGGRHRTDPRFLPDYAPQQHLEILA